MSALLSVELRRLTARRLVRLAVVVVMLGIVTAGVITFVRSHRLSAETLRMQAIQRQQFIQQCLSGQGPFAPPPLPPGVSPGVPTGQECQSIQFGPSDPRFHLTSLKQVFQGTTVPLVLLAWILGASFVGAEWHAGTMSTLLTWEPRRTRVLLAKAVVVIATAFVAGVVFQAVLGLALWPAALRGTTQGAGGKWLVGVAGVVLRGAALAAIGSAVGLSIATVARNTAAALGVGFAYLMLVENLISVLRPGWRSWFISWNAAVFLTASHARDLIPRTPVEAGLLLTAYGVGSLAIALVAFHRRDVT